MSRTPRIKSESGIYHIMLRGINKEAIFTNDCDKQRFIDILKKYRQICKFELYAYCIMNNHVHLLLKETQEFSLDKIIKRVACSYAFWYNENYSRIGHLFQDRFRSEPVDDDNYFLTALRYIHQNPIKAGICNDLFSYKWCSFADYQAKNQGFIDTDFALGIVSYNELMEFIAQPGEDFCLDEENYTKRKNFEQETFAFKRIVGTESFSNLDLSSKKEIIQRCRSLGIREGSLVKLTGLSRYYLNKF